MARVAVRIATSDRPERFFLTVHRVGRVGALVVLVCCHFSIARRSMDGAFRRSVRKPRGTLVFDLTAPPKQPAALLLRELTMFLAHQLNSTAANLPRPMLLELEQALIVTLLSAQRHNFTEILESSAKEPAPVALRLAEEYIEANWARAISIEELASQTNTSIRSLYAAFKTHRGYSPMRFAKSVRLRCARQMLLEGNPRTSVSQIAFKCGFGNLGQFASDFQQMFGELPSEVFARALRAR